MIKKKTYFSQQVWNWIIFYSNYLCEAKLNRKINLKDHDHQRINYVFSFFIQSYTTLYPYHKAIQYTTQQASRWSRNHHVTYMPYSNAAFSLEISHGSLRVFKCPTFCLHNKKIVGEAPAMYYFHLITRELNRQNRTARQSRQSMGGCQVFSLWLPSLHCSAQWHFPMKLPRIKTKGQAVKTQRSQTQFCKFN